MIPLFGPFRILAVDPGGTTGLAVFRSNVEPEMISWQAEGYDDAADVLVATVPDVDVVVVESFVIRSNTHKLDPGAFAQTTDLIGACRLLARENGIPLVRQTPAQAKGFASDAFLRKLGWYDATPGGHANDAARHLLTYLASQHYAPILARLAEEETD